MTLSKEEIKKRLRTELQSLRGNSDRKQRVNELRRKRIEEAIGWKGGPNPDNPETITVDTVNGYEAHFLKPGKEVENTEPNPHDMAPRVGELYTDFTFEDTWAVISKAGLTDFESFRFLLVLLYRNTYFLDHQEVDGSIRYRPDDEIRECIDAVDEALGGVIPGGVHELLYFLDLLGWNEDVKYQSGNKEYTLEDNFYTGRMNNMLTSINIPYKFSRFVSGVLEHSDKPQEIDTASGLETMQSLSQTRGTATPTQDDLVDWFSPMIYESE